ncbi:phenylalanyl-tRNA synthetase [Choiromyces venosus 120613-1]|uniref:Phenylalanine--tRNA ligase, mitochondrial n=1 Tax=Choiromyces venosus 120613-1 TaxID=1336337 RepID=A0A3N4K598_9PEZI|nr:phenylalanyl-tRNA synthetase [Choiromyces venosus 120613-1]
MRLLFSSRNVPTTAGAFGGFSGVIKMRGITQFHSQWRKYSTKEPPSPPTIRLEGRHYPIDEWTNLPSHISSALPRKLHLQPSHPLSITRRLIESRFPEPAYQYHNDLSPIVTVHQNFDSLGFPIDHPGRSRTDTYYINKDTVLRTHTSAHQADTFRTGKSDGFLISADVYRRDAIDRSHYPVFHQMEGARMWSRGECEAKGGVAAVIREEMDRMPKHGIDEPLRVRWVEAYFPFTSPSWELEVYWQGNWLELLGCGVVQQSLPKNAGVPDKIGWAFGVGLERVAMLLFGIPDIRLFWSLDKRFLQQFKEGRISRFVPFSKYPPCYKDIAFWLPSSSNSTNAAAAGGAGRVPFHENDMMEIVRNVAGDLAEDVKLIDEFTHPKTGRKSLCFRINYRSLERTLTNDEVNSLQQMVKNVLVEEFGAEVRENRK